MKRLTDVLTNTNDNHIFPLFWQHGEAEDCLRTTMKKIRESGIGAVCVEARPHPEFLKDKWWKDFDILLDEAKKLDMKLWILDDSHFPTGFADGAVQEKYPQYRKRFLKLCQFDFAGPMQFAQALIKYSFTDPEDRLEGVFLAKKTGYEAIDESTIVEITSGVRGKDTVSFSLPEGEWKVLVLVSTFQGGEKETEGYLNPIVPEATDVLINTVYEPHFQHYKEDFGKTILGFFSDEPRFGNIHGPNASIGRINMVLPWCDGMEILLEERLHLQIAKTGLSVKCLLPLLFLESGRTAWEVRYHYMDLVSDLYAQNFSQRIGSWCEAHGVEYIGHTIEDNNSSARLGYGAGHFFKAMKGQHMAGIDVVLHQLMPGMDHGYNKAMTGNGWDGEFFHYVLGKLGSSLGHQDPKKQGKTMCEVFGAYGWGEGNRLMKWIADYMLVRGVNEFCPHAFDPKEYPDPDCPPHFYANGRNPQFSDFRILMNYMNRLAHLLSGGTHHAPVAVSYHGEAEWSGDYMLMQKPCAVLCRNQIDYDILPQQTMISCEVKDQKLQVNGEEFQALVIPYAQALPSEYLVQLERAAEAGLQLYFIDALPSFCSDGDSEVSEKALARLAVNSHVSIVKLEELVPALREQGAFEVTAASYEPYLRYYHYEADDGHILMLVNEEPAKTIQTELTVSFARDFKDAYRYDAFENQLYPLPCGKKMAIHLAPYESMVVCWPKQPLPLEAERNFNQNLALVNSSQLKGPFGLSFCKQEDYPRFCGDMVLEHLVPMQKLEGKEDFTGVIRYQTTFVLDQLTTAAKLVLDTVYEGARISVNGSAQSIRICPPYTFDISDAVKEGTNTLEIEVTTTLAREQKDWLSQYMLLEPAGITNAIILEQYQ